MRVPLLVVMLLAVSWAGCITIEDKNATGDEPAVVEDDGDEVPEIDPSENATTEEEEVPAPAPAADPEPYGVGDSKDDTQHVDPSPVGSQTTWTEDDHRFRMPITVVNRQVGTPVRASINMINAYDEANLDWVWDGVPLGFMEVDWSSVVMTSVSKGGQFQNYVPVDARPTSKAHVIELAFVHESSRYLLYFDVEQADVGGGERVRIDEATDTTLRRGTGQWIGDHFWGADAFPSTALYKAEANMRFEAHVLNQGRDIDGTRRTIDVDIDVRAPAEWHDVEVDPEAAIVGNKLVVEITATAPEDAEPGTKAKMFVDVSVEGASTTIEFTVTYIA